MRTRQRYRAQILTAALGLVIWTVAASAEREAAPAPAAIEHVVQPGDTLWALATKVEAPGEDRRDLVWIIKAVNGLSSAVVYPGQRLVLPHGLDALRAARRDPRGFAATAVIAAPRAGRSGTSI